MTDERLTDELVVRVLGWRPAPDRYVKSGRSWISRWRFQPLTIIGDAFELLDASANAYTLATNTSGGFEAEVRVGNRIGKACGEPKARTITIALANALGLELHDEACDTKSTSPQDRSPRSRSKTDGI